MSIEINLNIIEINRFSFLFQLFESFMEISFELTG